MSHPTDRTAECSARRQLESNTGELFRKIKTAVSSNKEIYLICLYTGLLDYKLALNINPAENGPWSSSWSNYQKNSPDTVKHGA